jgi:cytochrome c peroxidase
MYAPDHMRSLFRYLLILLFPLCSMLVLLQCSSRQLPPGEQTLALYKQQLDDWHTACLRLQMAVAEHRSAAEQQSAFRKARAAYKRIEVFAEYFYPGTAKAINGPNVPDAELDAPEKIFDATGFQVLEEYLFPVVDTSVHADALAQAKALVSLAQRLKNGAETLVLTNEHIWDAVRLQLFRLQTIGISGADSPVAQASVSEGIASLEAMQQYLNHYLVAAEDKTLQELFRRSIFYLQSAPDFASLDRAVFISTLLNPLGRQLHSAQQSARVAFFHEARPLRADAKTLFDESVFNPWYYSVNPMAQYDSGLVQIGRELFYDVRLSGNCKRSCASCHNPSFGFTDGLVKNKSFDGRQSVFRNTPALQYAALQPAQFADSRTAYLEDQARDVIENHAEMRGNVADVCRLLSKDKKYAALVQQHFAATEMKPEHLQKALGAFTRSLPLFRSRFDAYMQGDAQALNKEEQQGFNLFMGKAKCGTCHFMPLFNGVVPPAFIKMESEIIGVPAQAKAPFTLDSDKGKYGLTRSPIHMHAFKTPTVRNSNATGPYMHNGVFKTLEEVIDFYNKGGGKGLGLKVENQTLPGEAPNLTAAEQQALIRFLHALSDAP